MVYRDPDYMKKWRARNKEKTRAYNAQDYKKRAQDPVFREAKRAQAQKWYAENQERGQAARQAYYEKHKERISAEFKAKYDAKAQRAKMLWLKYGLTLEQYDQMLAQQDQCCAICRTHEPGAGMAVFPVDHDHETGRIRGLLCNRCNRALGLLQDDRSLLQAAAAYLAQYET